VNEKHVRQTGFNVLLCALQSGLDDHITVTVQNYRVLYRQTYLDLINFSHMLYNAASTNIYK